MSAEDEPSDLYWARAAGNYRLERDDWIAYADKLEAALEFAAGQSKDQLMKLHGEQGLRLRLVRPQSLPNAATSVER